MGGKKVGKGSSAKESSEDAVKEVVEEPQRLQPDVVQLLSIIGNKLRSMEESLSAASIKAVVDKAISTQVGEQIAELTKQVTFLNDEVTTMKQSVERSCSSTVPPSFVGGNTPRSLHEDRPSRRDPTLLRSEEITLQEFQEHLDVSRANLWREFLCYISSSKSGSSSGQSTKFMREKKTLCEDADEFDHCRGKREDCAAIYQYIW